MGNEDVYTKFNNEANLPINIELNKVCFFPEETISGTITLCPTLELFVPLSNNPELIIIFDEYQYYTYTTKTENKKKVNHTYNKNSLFNIN